MKLAIERKIPKEKIELIEYLQAERTFLFSLMSTCSDTELKKFDRKVEHIEFALQDLWGFPLDKNYHKFWNRPRCSCPKMDNEDNYPYGYYTIDCGCKLHGRIKGAKDE